MTDDAARPATVLDRLLAAGIAADRASGLIEQGMVRADGEVLTDPTHPLPWPERWVIRPS